MAERHTFPQSGDNDDAENFAQMIGQDILSDFVVTGFGFNPNFTAPEVTINTGVCFISRDSDTTSSNSETRLAVNHAVQLPQETISLTDNATNYIYIVPNFGTNDAAVYQAYTSQSSASSNALLIGQVDTSNDTFDDGDNRDPSGAFQSLNITKVINLLDDVGLNFGTGGDFVVAYDSTNDLLSIDDVDGDDLLNFYQNGPVELGVTIDANSNDIVDGNTVIWNSAGQYIEQTALENDSITINANDGLKSGGTVALGGSVGLDIEPADFAGTFLSDDGTDDLQVDIGRGLENDGSGNIQFDEDTSYTFTVQQQFTAGLDTRGDIVDDTTTIWDSTGGHIEQTALENDSVTITAGDGLKNGGSVSLGSSTTINIEPADFAGTFLSDDGSDDLTVDIGRGLENDGSGNIQFDEDTSYTFTTDQTFDADLIDASSNVFYDQSLNHVPRPRVDDEKVTTSVTTNYTTSDEEVIYVDTSGGAVTVTLASADVADGNQITIIDSGGSSGTNNITIDTEGTETIDGSSSITIENDSSARTVSSDGTNWFTAGGGSGSGGVAVQDDDTTVNSSADTLDFGHGTNAEDAGGGEVNVVLMNTRDPRM